MAAEIHDRVRSYDHRVMETHRAMMRCGSRSVLRVVRTEQDAQVGWSTPLPCNTEYRAGARGIFANRDIFAGDKRLGGNELD
jgi:hypothetical protein